MDRSQTQQYTWSCKIIHLKLYNIFKICTLHPPNLNVPKTFSPKNTYLQYDWLWGHRSLVLVTDACALSNEFCQCRGVIWINIASSHPPPSFSVFCSWTYTGADSHDTDPSSLDDGTDCAKFDTVQLSLKFSVVQELILSNVPLHGFSVEEEVSTPINISFPHRPGGIWGQILFFKDERGKNL